MSNTDAEKEVALSVINKLTKGQVFFLAILVIIGVSIYFIFPATLRETPDIAAIEIIGGNDTSLEIDGMTVKGNAKGIILKDTNNPDIKLKNYEQKTE